MYLFILCDIYNTKQLNNRNSTKYSRVLSISHIYYAMCMSLLPPPRRLSVCLFVCEQDSSKTYGQILIKFSGYVQNGKMKK